MSITLNGMSDHLAMDNHKFSRKMRELIEIKKHSTIGAGYIVRDALSIIKLVLEPFSFELP